MVVVPSGRATAAGKFLRLVEIEIGDRGHAGIDVSDHFAIGHAAAGDGENVLMGERRMVLDLGESLEEVFAVLGHLSSP